MDLGWRELLLKLGLCPSHIHIPAGTIREKARGGGRGLLRAQPAISIYYFCLLLIGQNLVT